MQPIDWDDFEALKAEVLRTLREVRDTPECRLDMSVYYDVFPALYYGELRERALGSNGMADCGTAACAAGWLALNPALAPDLPADQLAEPVGGWVTEFAHRLAYALGLEHDEIFGGDLPAGCDLHTREEILDYIIGVIENGSGRR